MSKRVGISFGIIAMIMTISALVLTGYTAFFQTPQTSKFIIKFPF